MNLIFGDFQRREQKLAGQVKVAFRIVWRHATLVRPEKMDIAGKGWRAAVPDFSRFGQFNDRREKFLCDAPAGQRDAMQFARALGRFNFVQPRTGSGTGQFVGSGEGNQFKVFHLILEGRRVGVPNQFREGWRIADLNFRMIVLQRNMGTATRRPSPNLFYHLRLVPGMAVLGQQVV